MGSRPRYSLTSTNVGLVAHVVAPRPRTTPWTKQVLPAPSSPLSATTSEAASVPARRSPAAWVSSGLVLVSRVRPRIRSAPERGERIGQRLDHVARDEGFLAEARRGEVAGQAVEIDRGDQ